MLIMHEFFLFTCFVCYMYNYSSDHFWSLERPIELFFLISVTKMNLWLINRSYDSKTHRFLMPTVILTNYMSYRLMIYMAPLAGASGSGVWWSRLLDLSKWNILDWVWAVAVFCKIQIKVMGRFIHSGAQQINGMDHTKGRSYVHRVGFYVVGPKTIQFLKEVGLAWVTWFWY